MKPILRNLLPTMACMLLVGCARHERVSALESPPKSTCDRNFLRDSFLESKVDSRAWKKWNEWLNVSVDVHCTNIFLSDLFNPTQPFAGKQVFIEEDIRLLRISLDAERMTRRDALWKLAQTHDLRIGLGTSTANNNPTQPLLCVNLAPPLGPSIEGRELAAGIFRFLRMEKVTFPAKRDEEGKIYIPEHSDTYAVFAFRYSDPEAMEFSGFDPPDNGRFLPRFTQYRVFNKKGWIDLPVGYCGTGAADYALRPGEDYEVLISLWDERLFKAQQIKVSLEATYGTFWSEPFKYPKQ